MTFLEYNFSYSLSLSQHKAKVVSVYSFIFKPIKTHSCRLNNVNNSDSYLWPLKERKSLQFKFANVIALLIYNYVLF